MVELAASWLPRGELQALGWTLLHFCWQGAAIGLLYVAADRLTLRASSSIRYAIALGALALMPLMVALTFANEMQGVPTLPSSAGIAAHGAVIQYGIAERVPHGLAQAAESRGGWMTSRAERLLPWVDAAWMLGVLLLATRAMGGWWQLQRVRRRAAGMIPARLEARFREIGDLLQIGREVTLRVSEEVISPMAMGIWRATVILPVSALMQLSEEELEAVLAHELGHIRRWDYVCNLMQTAIESALFFHPAVWWMKEECANGAKFAAMRLRSRAVPTRLSMRARCFGWKSREPRNCVWQLPSKDSGERCWGGSRGFLERTGTWRAR